ncbi:2-succinyl-5-enolpyruvyl-6-hydroxy-3-cyclohexene-1-carboxylic-acid synthase [Nocardioides jiangxiensis]|uniref:2-succinyl-5-enolpyruvyl-6-hydroxy-3-cyclohexene-1-carboxylate synthase n=1 Tax=Nocardioides jiangxiensis TaxID=3064524 RepID=A0ABT9B1Q1_9ACTN|nr:2-succinyl-5-enolpyruvyl-6-hydroxy-3-cyclohexene-1-carboxylic-acid synthase [Nocardioides sp. WY-20]MDO7868613.1 2-succinyl-5-enolpyruvyl-6-hydroxy-3-cyclohexene-1-carboxylic-acid synthase [Nocardioides sp. WY-20]
MNASTLLARACIQELVDAGVTDLVLAPGSRNAPLAFAAYDADRQGVLRLHTRIDERTAGFLALGLAKSGRRSAVACTSGTAVANLFPAVMEAAHTGVPLVVVTADRPAGLRGTGASQTTDQVEVFGRFARFLDVAAADLSGPDLGDVRSLLAFPSGRFAIDDRRPSAVAHLNLQFELPLTPPVDGPATYTARATEPGSCRVAVTSADAHQLAPGPRTVVVAGDDAGARARQLAEAGGWPLFAEPTSGSRTGPHALRTYRLLLDGDLGRSIERVVVVGHPTLSRPVARLLARDDVEVISQRTAGIWPERPFAVASEHDALWAPDAEPDTAWLDAWRDLDRSVSRQLDRLLQEQPELTPWEVAAATHAALPSGGLLVVGASSPIRDLDVMAPPLPVGGRRKVIANRGLAGIDGTVSTAIGAALARSTRDPDARTIALMGDVTFLHDAGGLVIGPAEPRPDLTIVVVNDDGGSIFTMLEQGAPTYAEQYDRLFGTPHGVDIASLCASTRTPHWKVESLPELQQALDSPNGGIEVIEVRVRRDNRRELDAAIRALG